jgi:hypothetical protein
MPAIKLQITPLAPPKANSTRAPWKISGPKFALPPSTNGQVPSSSAVRVRPNTQPSGCTLTKPPLIVTVRTPIPRVYGDSNPAFAATTTGLLDGDTVAVTLQTTATPASGVGDYPVTATVSRAALANYTLTVIDSSLTVRRATLHIVAANQVVTYGQPPPQPTAYTLTGFVNGDTVAYVSGAPVLSTTVTSTTPVGFYKIDIQTGTLTATNYVFSGISNGYGSVGVYKAPLQLTATSLTMTHGAAVPSLTYSLTGFVNGQSAAGIVTGSPTLTTTATPLSRPGKYPITIAHGSLTSANYYFRPVNGVLTVSP